MQENMQKAQQELESKEVEASVGGGAVTVKLMVKRSYRYNYQTRSS